MANDIVRINTAQNIKHYDMIIKTPGPTGYQVNDDYQQTTPTISYVQARYDPRFDNYSYGGMSTSGVYPD